MKIFVAGATGVLGSRVARLLVAAGHEVTAVCRSDDKATALGSFGATPVKVDLFDRDGVRRAVAGHDVVCSLATHIPPLTRAALPGAWAENDRIRTEGVANLVDAAIAAGATRFIQEGLAFVYGDGGDAWLDETAPTVSAGATASTRVAEESVGRFSASGGAGVVLRFGFFYGADASHTRAQLSAARQGIAAFTGPPTAYQPMVHLDDAAAAVVAALGAPAGVYNVVEDRPGTRAEIAAAISDALGVAPLWLAPARLGVPSMAYLSTSQRVSNRAFRTCTGWAPTYPTPAAGWAQVVQAAGVGHDTEASSRRRRALVAKAALAYLALGVAPLAIWATLSPSGWFRGYPGGGHHWVAVDGPYNQHLAGDVGAFSLALLLLTVVALASRSRLMTRTAGAAWAVSGLPHLLYHLNHPALLPHTDRLISLGGLGLQVALGVVCVLVAPPSPALLPRKADEPVAGSVPGVVPPS